MAVQTIVNGRAYDSASLQIKINGKALPLPYISSLTYSDSLEPTKLRGSGSPEAFARTRGKYEAEDSTIEIWEGGVDAFERLVMPAAGNGLMEKVFSIQVHQKEAGMASHMHEIRGCRIKKIDHPYPGEGEAIKTVYSLSVMSITRDKLSPISNPRFS
jgi:hypothetical protein